MTFLYPASIWTAFNLLQVCMGFTVPTQPHTTAMFHRNRSTLRFQENDSNVAKVPSKDLAPTLLMDSGAPTAMTAHAKKKQSLRPLTFEVDIKDFLDNDRPYYALENEHAIVDDETGEVVGIVCTGRLEIPIGRESAGIPLAECLRHLGIAGSVAALLRNPKKKRHFYPASQYEVDVHPCKGKVKEELAKIFGGDQFYQSIKGNDPVILTRCIDFSKRMAKIEFLLENDDETWSVSIDIYAVAEALFHKKYPPPPVLPELAKPKGDSELASLKGGNPYGELGELINITRVWAFAGECLTMEATLPTTKPSDCRGHFYNNPTLPHSIMVFHNCDLIGQAMSEFTGVDIPFKQTDFGQYHGMKILSWTCLPETLHFANTGGLKLQTKVFISEGELGKPGSTYVTESTVKQTETDKIVYKATGTFILNPIKLLTTEFGHAIANREFDELWEKLDINDDGIVSRKELQQFVRSSGMADFDNKELDILFNAIDPDNNGKLSSKEVIDYFHSLHLGIKEDCGKSVYKYLKGGTTEDVVANIWSKPDFNGDGVVSIE